MSETSHESDDVCINIYIAVDVAVGFVYPSLQLELWDRKTLDDLSRFDVER